MVHIMNEARSGHPISKEVLKLLKSGLHMPDHIIKLFTVQVCLSLSVLKHHQNSIIEGLKNVVTKLIICNQKSMENAWFQEEVPGITDGKSVLLQLIQNVCQHGSWGLTGQAIVDLALALLDTNVGLGKPDYKTKTCWKLAQDIIRQVVVNQVSVAESIIKHLSRRIMFSKASVKYTDTLRIVITEARGKLMYKTSVLNEILEHTNNLSYAGGKRVFTSLVKLAINIWCLKTGHKREMSKGLSVG